jgi:hypothetical protein
MTDIYGNSRGALEFFFESAKGRYSDIRTVNKFGRSTNVDSGVATDIWNRANATNDQDIWLAPTAARTHNIKSASANDDGNPAGTGLRTLRIHGLQTWDSIETTEDITMNGTTDVPTKNGYVIIHRLEPLTWGSAGPNVGLITATAVSDDSVTAQINAGDGQTLMAIYGISSKEDLYIPRFYANFNKSGGAAGAVDISLLVNTIPDQVTTGYVTKHTFGLISTGTSALTIHYQPFKIIRGPAIIKIQGNGSAADLDVSAGFDGIVTLK